MNLYKIKRKPKGFILKLRVFIYSILIIAIIATSGYIYFLWWKSYKKSNAPLMVTQTGYTDIIYPLKCILIWEEKILTSNFSGTIHYIRKKELKKVSKGTAIAYIVTGNKRQYIYTPLSGIFCPKTDGFEGRISFKDVWNNQDIFYLIKRLSQKSDLSLIDQKQLFKGGTIGKIVKNFNLKGIAYLPFDEYTQKAIKRKFLLLREKRLQMWWRAPIYTYKKVMPNIKLVLDFKRFPNNWVLSRVKEFEVLLAHESGIIVPEKAIVMKEGKTGVYVIKLDRAVFKEVDYFPLPDNKVLIRKGLKSGEIIVKDPTYTEEGDKVSW